jgi:hypothetical protein
MQMVSGERCRSGGTGRHTELVPPRSASPSELRPAEGGEVALRGKLGSGAACDPGAAHGGAVRRCPRWPPGRTRPHADPNGSLGDLPPTWVRVRVPPSAAGDRIAACGLPFGARLHPPGRAPPRTGDGWLDGTRRRSSPPGRKPRLLVLGPLIRSQASAARRSSRPAQSTPSARSFAIASASRPISPSTSASCSPSSGARREIRHGVFSKR